MLALAVVALAAATAAGGPAPAPPPPPPRGLFAPADQPPHYLSDRLYHLRHVRIDLAFDLPRRHIQGTTTNTLSPLLPGLDHLVFHAAQLDVARVRLAGVAADLPFQMDPAAQTLTVQLPRAYGPQDVLEVAIDYAATPRAGLFVTGPDHAYPDQPWELFSDGEPQLNRYWFPSWDEPDDRATSELLATVERPLEAIGNGRLVEVIDRPDGRRTFHWSMEQPHLTYLVSVVIGEWSRTEDSWHGVPLAAYVPRALAERAPRSFAHTVDMMDFLSRSTGVPYPYPKYSQAAVYGFMWDGMENISATTVSADTLRDGPATLDSTSDELVLHELAHQWFGDYVSCRGWEHAWLNEGMATYFEALYHKYQGDAAAQGATVAHGGAGAAPGAAPAPGTTAGDDEMAWKLDLSRASYLQEDAEKYRRPLVTRYFVDPGRMFDVHTYDKGALVLHMLHDMVGDDAWRRGIHLYLTRYALGTVTSADLEAVFEEVSGVNLRPLFDQFVYGAGYPELKASWDYQQDRGLVRLELRQTQQLDGATGLFSFPVELALIGEDGRVEMRRVNMRAAPQQQLYVAAARRPLTVVFDPRGVLLKTLDFDKPTAEWIAQLQAPLPLAAHLAAARTLAGHGSDPATIQALGQALLHHRHRGAREVAAAALAAIGTDPALAALRRGAADADARVRGAVFASLAAFAAHVELIEPLHHALESDPSYTVRARAATALGHFDSRSAQVAPMLVQALRQTSYLQQVSSAALLALADLDAPQTMVQAEKLARYGSPRLGRGEAMLALARYAAHATPEKRSQARQILEGYLEDPDFYIREQVPQALGELGDPAAIPALERSLKAQIQDEQRHPREDALRALRQETAADSATAQSLEERLRQLQRANDILEERLRQVEADHSASPPPPDPTAGGTAPPAPPHQP